MSSLGKEERVQTQHIMTLHKGTGGDLILL